MKVITLIFIIAITMALSITFKMRNFDNDGQVQQPLRSSETETALHDEKKPMPSKRLSRFLASHKPKNPRAAGHCKKDNEICHHLKGTNSTTCCKNKCMDLAYDWYNCGACKKKCLVTESCCRGECVDLSYDKRHCGFCNNRCMPGGYCIYAICDYA